MATGKPARRARSRATGGGTAGRSRTRRTRSSSRRRSTPSLSTTVGAALGTLIVTSLLDASWPVRIGLVVVALLAGLAFVLWRSRSEAAGATQPSGIPDSPAAQGDPTHE